MNIYLKPYYEKMFILPVVIIVCLILFSCGKPKNNPPEISDIVANVKTVQVGETVTLSVPAVNDPDGDAVTFTWSANKGKVPSGPGINAAITYTAPNVVGQDVVTLVVSDGKGGVSTSTITLNIISGESTTLMNDDQIEVKITSPAPNSQANLACDVRGSYTGQLRTGLYAWVVVNPHPSPGQWWPQVGRLTLFGGEWHTRVYLGRENEDRGEKFDIAVITVNQQDDEYYRNYLREGEQTGNYPGIPLPESAVLKAKITVVRK